MSVDFYQTSLFYVHNSLILGVGILQVTQKKPGRQLESFILFLKTNMNAGHAGKAGRYHQIKETAFMYAFILETHNLL